MNNLYAEKKDKIIYYIELLIKADLIHAQYEELAQTLLAPSVDPEQYKDLLSCAAGLDGLLNEIHRLKTELSEEISVCRPEGFSQIGLVS